MIKLDKISPFGLVFLTSMSLSARGDPADLIGPILSRLQSMQNITVEYTSTIENIKIPPSRPGSKDAYILGISEQSTNTFRKHESYVRRDSIKTLKENGVVNLLKQSICISPDGKVELMQQPPAMAIPNGVIRTSIEPILRNEWVVDMALGLKVWDSNDSKIGDIFKIGKITTDGNNVTLTYNDISKNIHKWIFNPKYDYALIQYVIEKNNNKVEYICSDFKKNNALYMPNSITRKLYWATKDAAKQELRQTETINIRRVFINDPDNLKDSTFMVLWPPRSPIFDTRINKSFRTGEKAQTLTDEDIIDIFVSMDLRTQELMDDTKNRMSQIPPTMPPK